MDESSDDPTSKPTHTTREASEEGETMARHWVAIAVVSIVLVLLVVVSLMQATGVLDVMAPVAETETGQWLAVAGLAVLVIVIGAWSWRSLV